MSLLAVGVIGAGGMGSRHAMNLHRLVPGARVAGVYDLDRERAAQVAAQCGGAQAFGDPHALIADPAVAAVLVASPDPTHAEFVHACLRAGKPVLCEKPLATSAAAAAGIVEAELATGRRLIGVGFMRRFDPYHLAVRDAAAAGAIGRPIMFKGVHRNPGVPQHLPGPAVITSSAIHDIDSTRWLLGQEVTSVFVQGARSHESSSAETRDMLLLQFALTGGCLATIECAVAVEYGYEVSAELVGSAGAVVTGQPDPALVYSAQARRAPVPMSHLDRFQPAFVPELSAWVAAVRAGGPFPGASAWDGYMAALVGDACIRSLAEGAPVGLDAPERPALYR